MAREVSRVVADPGQIGTTPQVPFLTLPDPSNLFKVRARRTEALVAGNPFAPFLEFMAAIMRAQGFALAETRRLPAAPLEAASSDSASRPLLERGAILAAGDWREVLDTLRAQLTATRMPAEAAAALRALAARPGSETTAFADRVLDRRFIVAEAPEALFLMAALQVTWTQRAARVNVARVIPRETAACPLCGAAPVASYVGASGERHGLRFLVCSLCAAAWRHVRIKCTACGNTKGIGYHGIEGREGPAKAEACPECNAYAKIIYADKDADAEPLADDLGSLALDVLMSDNGWRRAYPNPFLAPGVG